jgi:hypothetical protein
MTFVHPKFVEAYGLRGHPIPPRTLLNIDGSVNKTKQITEEVREPLVIGNHRSDEKFVVANIGRYDVVLGRDVLRRHDPDIAWSETEPERMVFSSKRCSQRCLSAPADVYGIHPRAKTTFPIPKVVASAVPVHLAERLVNGWVASPNLRWPRNGLGASAAATESVSARIAKERPQKSADDVPHELHEYLDVFSEKESQRLAPHREYDCKIDLEEGANLKYQRMYNLSPMELDVLKSRLDEQLAKGWIRKSSSPIAAPIMFAGKKDGGLRLCVDYRNLNAATKKDRYPIPLPSEITDRLAGKKKMTRLDLRNGYHLVRIAEGDEWKTAFRTRYGQYEYLVMPFGLTNAPSVFQRFMNEIFHDLLDTCVIVYLDDILIFADTDEELLNATKEVLRRCKEHELYCKPEKCEFNVSKTEFLGFIVFEEGVAMDKTKLDAIMEWPAPTSVKQVQTFLGFANFYRRFINGYSKICRPINDLLKKGNKFAWEKPQQEAFEELKRRFTSAPLLAWPDFTKPFTIETDSSGFARGAILSQPQEDGKFHPVAYSSKSLSPAEQGYDIHDRELLAIVKAFVDWRHYLLGSESTVITDHRNLMDYILTTVPSRRQARWAEYLSQFKYKIHYRPGKYCRADGLSRRPDHDVGGGRKTRYPPKRHLWRGPRRRCSGRRNRIPHRLHPTRNDRKSFQGRSRPEDNL